ncbi:MAG TPA: helix-turn-helix domain-containing protein [Thermoleophilia bacterium]|nr:helix-turn-helix domain-containing protein [Thermoleophilia bacterium]
MPTEARLQALLDVLAEGPMTQAQVKERLGWSQPTVHRYLSAAVTAGTVVRHGSRGATPLLYPLVRPGTAMSVRIGYTNWHGELTRRTIIPGRIWFGATEHHTEPQWLLDAHCLTRGAQRTFAVRDIIEWRPETDYT